MMTKQAPLRLLFIIGKTMKQLLTTLLLLFSLHVAAGDIVVHEGRSIHDALRQAREWRRTNDPRCEGGITITVKKGRFHLQEPLFLRPEDSGTDTSPLWIKGEKGAIISGTPKQQHTQLWPVAKQQVKKNKKDKKDQAEQPVLMDRIVAFDAETRTITIPTPPDSVLQGFALGKTPLEMVVHQRWAIAILRVKDLQVRGRETVVSFWEPESRLEFEHPWPQPVIGGEKGNSSFLLRTTEQRDGMEQLMIIDGASHVSIEGLTFENTCWNRPLHQGHVTLQGGFPLIDAYKLAVPGLPWDPNLENQAWIERPVSAVTVRNAEHVIFKACRFQHLGATALDFADATSECTVHACHFEDVGGSAILAGSFAESPLEVHRPYRHLAERCRKLVITGNTIHHVTTEDWGAVAIGCGYVTDCVITGNDISQVNYSGICVGWGWTPEDTGMHNNLILGNKVSDYARQLYDAGGIYTLSNQPGSVIRDNIIGTPGRAPYATNDRAFRIYLDARTDGYTIQGNTTEQGKSIRRDDIGDNQPGPNLVFADSE